MSTTFSVAIIGAGASGLAAAHALRDVGCAVTLYEKSHSVGGRAATRSQADFIYDYGAQYIKRGGPVSVALITQRFYTPDLTHIVKPIWTFDAANQILEGDAVQNAEPRWTYRHGLATLFHQMAADLDIRVETQIQSIQQRSTGWTLIDTAGRAYANYARLLITIPAEQAITLLQDSGYLDPSLQHAILDHLGQVRYNRLISVMLGYRPRPRVRPYYALINTDKAHAISWLAWEHEKAPERAPSDAGLLVAQMAPHYSQEHYETSDDDIYADVAQRVSTLIDETLPTPILRDIQRWRYALPARQADANTLNALTLPAHLAFCGDAFVGGRLHLALEHGISVAEQLLEH